MKSLSSISEYLYQIAKIANCPDPCKHVGNHGYAGHEHLPGFGLINCNARLYDPALGRFLMPDPLVQDPASTQNFNRYSYCLNNPLKYTDESGEFWNYVIGAVLGGLSNVIANWDDIKAHGFWTGVGYFGIGAIAGTLTAAGAAWAAETIAAQGVALGSLVGAGTGGLSGGLSGYLTNGFNNIMRGQSFGKDGWNSFKSGAISGALFGSISGGIEGGIRALESGKNVWWGSDVKYGRNQWSLFTSEKPWDVLSTEINTIKKGNYIPVYLKNRVTN